MYLDMSIPLATRSIIILLWIGQETMDKITYALSENHYD